VRGVPLRNLRDDGEPSSGAFSFGSSSSLLLTLTNVAYLMEHAAGFPWLAAFTAGDVRRVGAIARPDPDPGLANPDDHVSIEMPDKRRRPKQAAQLRDRAILVEVGTRQPGEVYEELVSMAAVRHERP
jgi:hypothetical protein